MRQKGDGRCELLQTESLKFSYFCLLPFAVCLNEDVAIHPSFYHKASLRSSTIYQDSVCSGLDVTKIKLTPSGSAITK
jgi:hypothetical protein